MIRAFLAVELGREILDGYAALRLRESSRRKGLRWVRPENVHITLRFLGDTAEERLAPLGDEVERAVGGLAPFRVAVGAPGCFGPRRAPSVLWFDIGEGREALEALARAVDEASRRVGFPPDDKPWRAHLTVARNPGRAHIDDWEDVLRGSGIPGLSFDCREVVLFSSRLASGGPTYVPMFQAPLKAEGRQAREEP